MGIEDAQDLILDLEQAIKVPGDDRSSIKRAVARFHPENWAEFPRIRGFGGFVKWGYLKIDAL